LLMDTFLNIINNTLYNKLAINMTGSQQFWLNSLKWIFPVDMWVK
jgi:hypothetical protein